MYTLFPFPLPLPTPLHPGGPASRHETCRAPDPEGSCCQLLADNTCTKNYNINIGKNSIIASSGRGSFVGTFLSNLGWAALILLPFMSTLGLKGRRWFWPTAYAKICSHICPVSCCPFTPAIFALRVILYLVTHAGLQCLIEKTSILPLVTVLW